MVRLQALFIFPVLLVPSNELRTGDKIPPFMITSVTGEMIHSDSLKGKILVIDFWASWCQPSRKNFPETAGIYEKYRKKFLKKEGKTVFINISIDTRYDLWYVATRQDNLYWPFQVCDFNGWESSMISLFKLRKVPANFVINDSGYIVATDTWGKDLDSLLSALTRPVP